MAGSATTHWRESAHIYANPSGTTSVPAGASGSFRSFGATSEPPQ